MRIIAGRFKGRALTGPKSDATRPTSDRLRETIFNVLAHRYGDPCEGARVLDLFAGTGALGLEAISRGAVFAALVDVAAGARAVMRANVDALGLGGEVQILKRDATKLGAVGPFEPFSLVFLDPPYAKGLVAPTLDSLIVGGWLAPAAVVVAETRAGEDVPTPSGFEAETRIVGESSVIFLTRA